MSWDAVGDALTTGLGWLVIGFLLALAAGVVYVIYDWLIHSKKAMTVFFFSVLAFFLYSGYTDLVDSFKYDYWAVHDVVYTLGERDRIHLDEVERGKRYVLHDAAYGGTGLDENVWDYKLQDDRLYARGQKGFWIVQYKPMLYITLLEDETLDEKGHLDIEEIKERLGTTVFRSVNLPRSLEAQDLKAYNEQKEKEFLKQ